MKHYDELNEYQKTAALSKARDRLLEAICEGRIRFNDALNGDNLQARIDAAFKQYEDLRTPWFVAEAIMETCADEIDGMAQCDAEDALYAEPGEVVVSGVIGE
jgi:hypothetical protein